MSHIQIAVNGILFDFEHEKQLASLAPTCDMCILNSNHCEMKCLDINIELNKRKKQSQQ